MKITLFLTILLGTIYAYSAAPSAQVANKIEKSYSFQFKVPKFKAFLITQTASTKEQAFKLAASECFKKLTGNKYPGEEKGLEIIDVCANPKM